jgi:hypothetical protein
MASIATSMSILSSVPNSFDWKCMVGPE